MLFTLSHRAAICQSDAEVYLTGVAPLGAVSHRFNFNFFNRNTTKLLIIFLLKGLEHLCQQGRGQNTSTLFLA